MTSPAATAAELLRLAVKRLSPEARRSLLHRPNEEARSAMAAAWAAMPRAVRTAGRAWGLHPVSLDGEHVAIEAGPPKNIVPWSAELCDSEEEQRAGR